MIHINIICVGKIKENYLKEAITEYAKRLSKYCVLNITELNDKPLPEKLNSSLENQIKNYESTNIISHIKKDSYNICLDLSGKEYSSEDFAYHLNLIQQHYSSINFIIGGSLGINDELKAMCNEKIRFSKMTFPHQLFRVFLLEQLFRSFKINNNEKYHH